MVPGGLIRWVFLLTGHGPDRMSSTDTNRELHMTGRISIINNSWERSVCLRVEWESHDI